MIDQELFTLENMNFDNRFTRLLPADPQQGKQARQVFSACYSRVQPTPVSNPSLIIHAPDVAGQLGISSELCQSDAFVQLFSGNHVLPGMNPHACCYGGHQFGNWAGQLGDGRVINLGELISPQNKRWMLQLKGAGRTPYSRSADGLAVLRSSVREFLCSEAMFHLGIPTTRALSLILTGEQVMRDMFYDGHAALEPGAIVCRAAPSFTRFGSFQIFASRGDTATLKALLDHTITTDFPHLGEPKQTSYVQCFEAICQSTAELMVDWMRVGFVHGVMNTDNMSVLGLSIDYGPYGWLEDYNPDWTPNTTDKAMQRYCYGQQAAIAGWNLARLAEAILPLIGDAKPLQEALNNYSTHYNTLWQNMMADKLGLQGFEPQTDAVLIDELQRILSLCETDMSIFYRKLATLDATLDPKKSNDSELMRPLLDAYYKPDEIKPDTQQQIANWLRSYILRLQQDGRSNAARKQHMNRHNPKYVLRNYLVQIAIDQAATGDYSEIHRLYQVIQRPYDEQSTFEAYAAKRPEWARNRAGCSMLSCSS